MPDLLSGLAVALALVGLLSALSFCTSLPRWVDLQGAPAGQLTGTVTEVGYDQRAYDPRIPKSPWKPHLALLRVDGRFLDLGLYSSWHAPWLLVGQRITVHYRRGKSGREYVDRIDPVTDTEDHP